MTPTLIGYLPKRTMKRPDWLKTAGVDEVCSVSTCLSEPPDGWIDKWQHNDLWLYNSPDLARSVVPESGPHEFDLYAYRLFPAVFIGGRQQPFEVPPLPVQPMPASFESLGCDAVSRSYGSNFECSPLSCNHMAEHIPTNRHCLVDDAETAFRLAGEFEARPCEPGPYHVLEVWRQKRRS